LRGNDLQALTQIKDLVTGFGRLPTLMVIGLSTAIAALQTFSLLSPINAGSERRYEETTNRRLGCIPDDCMHSNWYPQPIAKKVMRQ
jgi:hypothetical protein